MRSKFPSLSSLRNSSRAWFGVVSSTASGRPSWAIVCSRSAERLRTVGEVLVQVRRHVGEVLPFSGSGGRPRRPRTCATSSCACSTAASATCDCCRRWSKSCFAHGALVVSRLRPRSKSARPGRGSPPAPQGGHPGLAAGRPGYRPARGVLELPALAAGLGLQAAGLGLGRRQVRLRRRRPRPL